MLQKYTRELTVKIFQSAPGGLGREMQNAEFEAITLFLFQSAPGG